MLDVRWRKALDAESWIRREDTILDRRVEADDQRSERVVDRLRGDLSCFGRLGLFVHPGSHLLDAELVEANITEGRNKTLAAIDLVGPPGVRLEVWLAVSQPSVPPACEGLLGVPNLAPVDLLHESPACFSGRARTREPALARLLAVAAANDIAPARALRRAVRIHPALSQSENNRRAKFYRLTAAGRKRLSQEASDWRRLAGAIARVMGTA